MCGVSKAAGIFLAERRLELVERLPDYVASGSHEGEGGSLMVIPRSAGLLYSSGCTEDALCRDQPGDFGVAMHMCAKLASWGDDSMALEGWPWFGKSCQPCSCIEVAIRSGGQHGLIGLLFQFEGLRLIISRLLRILFE